MPDSAAHTRGMRRSAVSFGLLLSSFSTLSHAADSASPGAVTAPYPTLHNASIEWALDDDDNRNASATVQFRKLGDADFRTGLPLFRVPAGSNQGFDWTSKLSGSLFGLEPGTTYEVQLDLTDPDGGDAAGGITFTTRAEPVLPDDANEIAVDPDTIADALEASAPGDVLVLADGSYGEIVFPNDGSESQFIGLRAANPGGAVIEGDVRIDGRSYVFVQDLLVHGKFKFNDAAWIVVRGCTIQTPDDGIVSYGTGVSNAYIAHNVISGPTEWSEAALGVDGDNLGEGVQLTGPGNVVAFNRVSGFRDCLSLLEDDEAVNQVSDDFYGNDLFVCADDAIEADFAMGNVRVYQNRIADSFMGLSSQPSLGGPTYFVRNVMYNVLFQAFKLQRSSVGDVGFHNTVVKSGDAFSVNTEDVFSRAYFRNNLFIGGPGGDYNGYDSGPGDAMQLPSADASCSFDYDGYGSIGTGAIQGRVGGTSFSNFAELQSMTTEAHAVELDLSTFAADVAYPADPFATGEAPSLELASDGDAVDQGTPLDNVNDGFAGDAPDLGAYEIGAELPSYGPGGNVIDGTGGQGNGANPGFGGAPVGEGGGDGSGAVASGVGGSGASVGFGAANGNGANGNAPSGESSGDDGGCGCRVLRAPSNASVLGVLVALAAFAARRRRLVRSA
jgi:hypothetical protein